MSLQRITSVIESRPTDSLSSGVSASFIPCTDIYCLSSQLNTPGQIVTVQHSQLNTPGQKVTVQNSQLHALHRYLLFKQPASHPWTDSYSTKQPVSNPAQIVIVQNSQLHTLHR
jgi:hypothetical protein